MWSEPFIVRRGNTRVALLLVNVQNFAYTFPDLIRGDSSLIHMFRLISSVSTIVIINNPGLKQHPHGSGHRYMIPVNSYQHFLTTLNQWECDNYETLMANVTQITDRSENYRKLNQEFNNNSTYLVSCPTYDVKNIDWKVGDLPREYGNQMKTFIRVDALDVSNVLSGITFTNTDQLMKAIEGKIHELNHNNSVNSSPTLAVPIKQPTPAPGILINRPQTPRMSGQSPFNRTAHDWPPLGVNHTHTAIGDTIGSVNDEEVMIVFDKQLLNRCKPDVCQQIDDMIGVSIEALQTVRNSSPAKCVDALSEKFNEKFPVKVSHSLDMDLSIGKMAFDSKYKLETIIGDQLVRELVENFTKLMQNSLNYEFEFNIKRENFDKIFAENSKRVMDLFDRRSGGLKTLRDVYSQNLRKLLDDQKVIYANFDSNYNEFVNKCQQLCESDDSWKETFRSYTDTTKHGHLGQNRQNHQCIKTEINNILLQSYLKYCTQTAAKLSKSGYIESKQFDEMHKQLLDQLLTEQEQQVMTTYKTRFADTYLREICDKNRESIALNVNHSKAKYWTMNESKRNKSQTLIMDFESKPIGVYYSDKDVDTVYVRDPRRHRTSNCIAFDGQRLLFGREAEQHLNGHTFDIKDLMGRDVTDDELNRYPFEFVDKRHPKVRLAFEYNMSYDLNIESLIALQILGAKTDAEEVYDNYVKNMVFVVPTQYTIRQLNAFQDAARLAGIEHVQFITQMSSLAIDFGFNDKRHNRAIGYPYVLFILLTDSGCELALVEYQDISVKYKAYELVDIDWPPMGTDFSAINEIFIDSLQQLFDNFKTLDKSKVKEKVYDCFIVGEQWQTHGIDFPNIMDDYCSELTFNHDGTAIMMGAVYYKQYFETNGHNIPITGVLFRDIVCHNSSRIRSEILLPANKVPKHFPVVQYRLDRSDQFPMTVRITEGTDSVIKEYVLSEYPTGYKHSQTLHLYITIANDLNDKNCIDFNINFEIGMNNMRQLEKAQSLQSIFRLTQGQISEQTELIANLIKPVSLDTHCSHDMPIVYDCDYYSNNTNIITLTTSEAKPNDNNKLTNERSKAVTKKKPTVTESELGAFVTKLIENYSELISQLPDTCDPDTPAYRAKSRDMRNTIVKKFDTEFGRKEPTLLVADQRLILIARLETKNIECTAIATEMVAKSANKLQELVESCVKEFNDKMIAAIDQDIEMNGVDNNYNKIQTNVNKLINNLFNNRAISISKRESQRKLYSSRLTQNISQFSDKYKYLYDCNESYQKKCGHRVGVNRDFPDGELRDMQREVVVPTVLSTNSQLMDKLRQMYDKSYRYFTTELSKIRSGEQELANNAIELTVVKYRELFHHVLMSKFYIPTDLNAIHNKLVPKCLVLLEISCAFTSRQSDLEDKCVRKCADQLSDAFAHIKVDYTAKLRRLFTFNTNIVRDMHRKYCQNVRKHLAYDYIDVDKLQGLLDSESNDIMNAFTERMDPIGREWDRCLMTDIARKHRQSLDLAIREQMREYRLTNFRNATITPTMGIYFGRRLLVGAYFDRTVQFVPNGEDSADNTHSKHYVDNCITFSGKFLFGRKAKQYLRANSLDTEFDVKDLLGRDRVDAEELKRYRFEWCSDSPPKVCVQSPVLQGNDNGMNVETLVALQVLDIKHRAETAMKTRAQRVVLCLPTGYNSKQRRAMLDVGLIASIHQNYVHIVNEMTAAAIAYVIDSHRKLLTEEIVLIFAIHGNHCECGLIKLSNGLIEHVCYGVVGDLSIFDHGHRESRLINYITNTMTLSQMTERDLNRVLVIGHSDKIPEFKALIAATLTSDFAGKHNILYKCDPIDMIVKGTVYYGQMLDKKLDTIDVREIVRADIKLMLLSHSDKHLHKELIPMNAAVDRYVMAQHFSVDLSDYSFPIELYLMEGETIVKTFVVNESIPLWRQTRWTGWTALVIEYRMDRDTHAVCLSATLKASYLGDDLEVRPEMYGLSEQCITGQRIILRELGVLAVRHVPNIMATNRNQSMPARVQSVSSAPLTPSPSRVVSVPNAISTSPMAAAVAVDAVQEFSQLCAGIKARLETCGAIATKRRKIAEKLLDFEKCPKTDAKKLEEQKQQLFRLIDGYNLRDKLITN
ncbi:unnamed protein product [Medioppia subpectinata]|uniref:Uncharacterized protein n=1 Tax=Medioppia subpectinata TaxID=1979941 RepID=A0A7R9KDH9_9ACAR|nr:unnamed protein product [Medioppia subpectinata]CAG2101099.1 unnamed protein product [Medioppia subpectinata]